MSGRSPSETDPLLAWINGKDDHIEALETLLRDLLADDDAEMSYELAMRAIKLVGDPTA